MTTPIQFSFYNHADAATLSSGSWLAGAPLTNLQQPLLSLRARSTNDDLASTTMRIDLGATIPVVRLIAFARHNLSTAATVRILAGTTAGASDVYDSGSFDAWPAVYLPEDLEWEDDNFWSGQITAAEAAGYPISLIHDCGENIVARYWTISFSDTSNPDTYVELARLWMGPIWSPRYNFAFGNGFAWESRTVAEYSLGGVAFFDERPPARVLSLRLPALSAAEAFGAVLDAQRRLGTSGQLWVRPAPDDAAREFKRSFLAHFRQVDPIVQAFASIREAPMVLEELL